MTRLPGVTFVGMSRLRHLAVLFFSSSPCASSVGVGSIPAKQKARVAQSGLVTSDEALLLEVIRP